MNAAALTEHHNRRCLACCNLEIRTMTVYVPADQAKKDVDHARVYVERSGFPKMFMVLGVSNLGKTSLHFIEEDVKMNRYINEVLAKMLPEIHALSDGDFIFQQDEVVSYCTCNIRIHS